MSSATRPARSAALLLLFVGCALPLPPGAHYDAPAEDATARPDVIVSPDVVDAPDAALDAPDRIDVTPDADAALDVPDRADVALDADAALDVAVRPDAAPDADAGPDVPDRPDAAPDVAPDGGCGAGRTRCELVCTDTSSDRDNCGVCNSACQANQICSRGACVACPSGQVGCGASCTALAMDAANCGACGRACAAAERCDTGLCVTDALLSQQSCVPMTSGCGMAPVPGATFTMGTPACMSATDPACGAASSPPQPSVTVSNFAIDRYEVTVARFRRWVAAGRPAPTGAVRYRSGMMTFVGAVATDMQLTCDALANYARMDREDHPINCVDWATAQAFCVWDGGRLPTQAEWELAARGAEGRIYPWGNTPPDDTRLCWNGTSVTHSTTCRVGSLPAGASPLGIHDLVGNVAEWNADQFQIYHTGGATGYWRGDPVTDPLCNEATTERVIRGGSAFASDRDVVRSASRGNGNPTFQRSQFGFRCARDVP
ncbi:MAG: SUMF1/EgtB/PvdO family nonheme iron enzyme [Polyangiales bacterium]